MTEYQIRRRDLARPVDGKTHTSAALDPDDGDMCRVVLRRWCKTQRLDPEDHEIRVRKDGRHNWKTYEV